MDMVDFTTYIKDMITSQKMLIISWFKILIIEEQNLVKKLFIHWFFCIAVLMGRKQDLCQDSEAATN
jgi:hypothetical protein